MSSELPQKASDNWTFDGFFEAFKTWNADELPAPYLTSEGPVFGWIEAMEQVREMQELLARCIECKFPCWFFPHTTSLMPGHCYSEAGVREVRISGLCEWCFDEFTQGIIEEIKQETQSEPDDD